jgi:acetylornithine deacetylase/succinyl-diaminopimelate desuccinylase-like protein
MTDSITAAIQYLHQNHSRFLDELKTLASIPSISTDPASKPAVQKTAAWIADHLRSLGIEKVQIFQTPGHPIVYGEYLEAGQAAPTVLVYGHYDVQPAEPLDLWVSGAFEPSVRGEHIYARGVTDMKGQVLAVLNAIEAILKTGSMPVNLKFLIEGEEEIGSPNLAPFIREHKDLLACNLALNPDSGILSADQPSVVYALRGLAYFELRVQGPDHDLHSGQFGGVVHNPANALSQLIAGMHDAQGRITLPGFYDRVVPIRPEEHAELGRLPMDGAYFKEQTGVPEVWGDPAYLPVERATARPTLDVNGLLSGYTAEGTKTVLPSWAMAKLSCRLVPDQQPEEVHQQMIQYLETHAPPTIKWSLHFYGGSPAAASDRNSAGVKALSQAMQTVWGKPPVFKREGGSVPVVLHFRQILGVESVNTGFAMPADNLHSPNEKLHLPTWYRGTDMLVHFFFNLVEGQVK